MLLLIKLKIKISRFNNKTYKNNLYKFMNILIHRVLEKVFLFIQETLSISSHNHNLIKKL